MSCKPAWASSLKQVGLHYYAGIVDDGEEISWATKLPHSPALGHGHQLKRALLATQPQKRRILSYLRPAK